MTVLTIDRKNDTEKVANGHSFDTKYRKYADED